jgi:hypothetical protein
VRPPASQSLSIAANGARASLLQPHPNRTVGLMPHTAFVAGYDGGTFLIECDGKEVVVYGEAAHGFQFDAGWGVEPAHLYVGGFERSSQRCRS